MDNIENALNQAKAPQYSVEDALAQSQPTPQGGLMDTASHLANFYYGAAKTEASKVLSAFSVGFQDKWGAQQSQLLKDNESQLKQIKHPTGGDWASYLSNTTKNAWESWNYIARNAAAESTALRTSFAEGIYGAAHQAASDLGRLPSEEELLKLGFTPDQIHKAYSMVQESGAAPSLKAGFHHFVGSSAPTAAAFQVGSAGAEAMSGFGPVGSVVGAVGGGIAGYFGGQKAQDYLLQNLPEKWQELLGQSQKQREREEIQHPVASLAGNLLPGVAGFGPLEARPVAKDASLLMKALAHPLGQRAISAVVMGDFEAVQELWNEGHTDSDKVGIAATIGAFYPGEEGLKKVKLLNENSVNPKIDPILTEAKANGVIGTALTPEQQAAKAEAIANLPGHKVVNAPPEVIEGPHSTEEAVNSTVSQNYKIATDAGKQLVKVGRSSDEASALGVLIQNYFETRAARFKGKLGTAQELYDKEFPEILKFEKAPQEDAGELSQRGTDKEFKTNPAKITDEHASDMSRIEAEATKDFETKHKPEILKERELNQDETKPLFYSALAKGVEDLNTKKAPADQWLQTIRNLKGVKKEEIQWSGLEDWLKDQKGSVSKDDVQKFLHENQVRVQDVEHASTALTENEYSEWAQITHIPASDRTDLQWARYDELKAKLQTLESSKFTKYGQYVLPGGRNYRELLLTLPDTKGLHPEEASERDSLAIKGMARSPEEDERLRELNDRRERALSSNFKGAHWEEPNVLAHVRFDSRTGPNGEKILHVAELQSDWHQKGRREGYKGDVSTEKGDPTELYSKIVGENYIHSDDLPNFTVEELIKAGVSEEDAKKFVEYVKTGAIRGVDGPPDAPFKQSWHELAFKRMLRYAAENGYDKLSWDTGATNADRFDLSRQVDKIRYTIEKDLYVYPKNGEPFVRRNIDADKLDDHIGKEAADKIKEQLNSGRKNASLEGLDLKIGGEGMKGFYDKILPDFARKYTKKWGGKVEDTSLSINKPFQGWVEQNYAGDWWVRGPTGELLGTYPTEEEANRIARENKLPSTAENKQVHSVSITPEMKESVLEGQPLFQAGRRGSLVLRSGKNLLKVFGNADASTIIHELGHDWLEAFQRDAYHPDAPPELVQDRETIRTWYNSKRGRGGKWEVNETIPKAAHEMWARGFERYLMEGVAPSKGLAVVFAKFKAWLSKIYESVTRLKSPINDDVRSVFDRLLSQAPTKTTIFPDLEMASRAPESPIGPLPQDAGTGVPVAKDPLSEPSMASSEQTEFSQKELIDKDGNFRINQITGYDDFNKSIKQYITKTANKIQAEKGNITPEANIDFASSLGLKPADAKKVIDRLNTLFGGPEVPVSGKMYALGKFLNDSTKHLADMLENGSKDEILMARQTMTNAMRTFETARTDWGFTGLALQQLYKEADKAGNMDEFFQSVIGKNTKEFHQELDRMRALAKKKGITVEELIKQQRAEASPKLGPMISEIYRSNLITGLFTHTYYAEANKIYAMFKLYPTTAFQAAASSIKSVLPKGRFNPAGDKVRWGELAEITYNLKSAQADALRAVADSFKAGQSLGMTLPRVAVKKADYELANGITKQEDYQDRINYLIEHPTPEMLLKSTPPKNVMQTKAVPGIAGDIIRVGGERMAAPLHSEAYVFMQQLKLSQLIYREAANQGLTGEALAQKIAQLKYDTPLDLLQASRKEALKATLLSNQSQLAKHLIGLSRWKVGSQEFQPLVILEPFVSIAADILHIATFDLTPAGIFSKEIRDNAIGRNGPTKQAEAVGNLMLGTALMGTVWNWLDSGSLTGPAPQDKKKALIERAVHGYPYSFHVGNHAISIERLGPIGTAIALMSDFIQGIRSADPKSPLGQKAVQMGFGILHNVGAHLLEGIGPFSGFTKLYDIERDSNAFEQWGSKTIASAIDPASVFQSQIAHEIDPYQRNVKGSSFWQTTLNQLKAQTPGLSESLPARIDLFGEPVPNVKFEGVYIQQLRNDPVWQYFDRHPDLLPSYVRQPKKFKLSQDQMQEYQMKAGFYLKQSLNEHIDSAFEQLPESFQKTQIQGWTTDARNKAKMELQLKDRNLIKQEIDSMQGMFK